MGQDETKARHPGILCLQSISRRIGRSAAMNTPCLGPMAHARFGQARNPQDPTAESVVGSLHTMSENIDFEPRGGRKHFNWLTLRIANAAVTIQIRWRVDHISKKSLRAAVTFSIRASGSKPSSLWKSELSQARTWSTKTSLSRPRPAVPFGIRTRKGKASS